MEYLDDNVRAAISAVLGAVIGVFWIWFALLGIQTVGVLVALFIALAASIVMGTIIGVIWIPKTKES